MNSEYTRYQQYLDKLQRPHIAATKIEWLNDDGSVAFDITEDAIQSGTLNVQYNPAYALRRTFCWTTGRKPTTSTPTRFGLGNRSKFIKDCIWTTAPHTTSRKASSMSATQTKYTLHHSAQLIYP